MKLNLILLSFVITATYAQPIVEFFDEQLNNYTQLTLRIKVTNNTPDTLKNVQLKYILPYDSTRTLVKNDYYLASSITNFDTTKSNIILNVNIENLAPGVFPNSSGISIGLNYADYQNFNKIESFSYSANSIFSPTSKIPVYANGVYLAGDLPQNFEYAKLRFNAIQPENIANHSAWIELENYSKNTLNLSRFKLFDLQNHKFHFSNINLNAGEKLRICYSNLNCPNSDVVIIDSTLNFGKMGEFVLNLDSIPIDYIAFGGQSAKADSLKLLNENLNTSTILKTDEEQIFGPIRNYFAGNFYKLKNNFWQLYRLNEIILANENLAVADPLSLFDSVSVSVNPNEKMTFTWISVSNAAAYELIILNAADSTLAYSERTSRNSAKVNLPAGRYLWNTFALNDEQTIENIDPIVDKVNFKILRLSKPISSDIQMIYDLHVAPLAARKDSYLLDLKWGEHILDSVWDRPHNLSAYYDEFGQLQFADSSEKNRNFEEEYRCWAVGAAMLNHYYGGNLTQDEIKLHTLWNSNDSILEAFPHRENGGIKNDFDISEMLMWVLNLQRRELNKIQLYGFLDKNEIDSALSQGRPAYVSSATHIMIVDAKRYNKNNETYEYRFLNWDNNGSHLWLKNIKGLGIALWLPNRPQNPRMTDSLIHKDSDNDGLMDFDEIYRFKTNPNNADSDGDGISDKIEIMSYTLLEKYPNILGVKIEKFADIDNDGLRAELDFDSDNGGVSDGDEDKNHNGLRDAYETSPYISLDDSVQNLYDSMNLTFYALNQLSINDGVICHYDTSFCSLASANISQDSTLSLTIGARASVGELYSRGNVFLRSNAKIYGNLNLSDSANLTSAHLQNGATIFGEQVSYSDSAWKQNFPLTFDIESYNIGTNDLIVKNNETAILHNGDNYKQIKVERGGILYISPGEIFTENVQLDAGSKVYFLSEGAQTILHVNGTFSWRAETVTNDLAKIARGFKIVQHALNKRMYISKVMGVTIIAPYSDVFLGQNDKLFYGSVIANNITVHQYTKVYHINFNPINAQYVIEWR